MSGKKLKDAPVTTEKIATPAEISIMYALGMKDRAQYNARCRHYNIVVGAPDE